MCVVFLNHYLILWVWQQKVFVCLLYAHYSVNMAGHHGVCVCLCMLLIYMSMESVFKGVLLWVFDLIRSLYKKQMVVIVLAHNSKKTRTTKLSHLHTGGITDYKVMYTYIHNLNSAQIQSIRPPQSPTGIKVVIITNTHTHTHALCLSGQGGHTVPCEIYEIYCTLGISCRQVGSIESIDMLIVYYILVTMSFIWIKCSWYTLLYV